MVALKPLHDAAGLKRVVVATYQSAAGRGRRMLQQLLSGADPVSLDMLGLLSDARHALRMNAKPPIAGSPECKVLPRYG